MREIFPTKSTHLFDSWGKQSGFPQTSGSSGNISAVAQCWQLDLMQVLIVQQSWFVKSFNLPDFLSLQSSGRASQASFIKRSYPRRILGSQVGGDLPREIESTRLTRRPVAWLQVTGMVVWCESRISVWDWLIRHSSWIRIDLLVNYLRGNVISRGNFIQSGNFGPCIHPLCWPLESIYIFTRECFRSRVR